MTIEYTPSAGFSYDYWCPVCGVLLGNSQEDKELVHPLTGKYWIKTPTGSVFKEIEPSCGRIGKRCALPKHQVEALDISQRIA